MLHDVKQEGGKVLKFFYVLHLSTLPRILQGQLPFPVTLTLTCFPVHARGYTYFDAES